MIGFEIKINCRKPIIAASDNFTSLILAYGYSSDRILIKGGDDLHYLTWFDRKPEVGDKVLIKVIETDKVSPVLTIEDCDRNEMLERYERLKIELQEKGLI